MSNFGGYLQLRRAIFEHVRDGRLPHMEALAYIYMATQADTRTGVWIGSAGSLAGELCCNERSARWLLEGLSRKGYIRRFPVPGRHFCYPILVNKYLVTDGEHAGERLNAVASESWSALVFEKNGASCEHTVEHPVEHVVGHIATQNRIKNREEKQHPKKRDADPRFKPIVDSFFEGTRKLGIEPGCNSSDFGQLSSWLDANPSRPLENILTSLGNAFASSDPHPLRPGFRLREFLSHESKYQRGPLLKAALRSIAPPRPMPIPSQPTEDGKRRVAEYGIVGAHAS